jgi:hypothetical protein
LVIPALLALRHEYRRDSINLELGTEQRLSYAILTVAAERRGFDI